MSEDGVNLLAFRPALALLIHYQKKCKLLSDKRHLVTATFWNNYNRYNSGMETGVVKNQVKMITALVALVHT